MTKFPLINTFSVPLPAQIEVTFLNSIPNAPSELTGSSMKSSPPEVVITSIIQGVPLGLLLQTTERLTVVTIEASKTGTFSQSKSGVVVKKLNTAFCPFTKPCAIGQVNTCWPPTTFIVGSPGA